MRSLLELMMGMRALAEFSGGSLLVLGVAPDCIAEAVAAAKVVADLPNGKVHAEDARAPRRGLCYGHCKMPERSVAVTC